MNKKQFLDQFISNLQIGGPKRTEIITEIAQHISEGGVDQFGDPKRNALTLNQVHLGFFFSFRRLLFFRLLIWIVFEILLPYGAFFLYYQDWERVTNWTPYSLILAAASISPLITLLLGAHAVSAMHNRWQRLLVWILFVSGLSLVRVLLSVLFGLALYTSASSTPWYVTTITDTLLLNGLTTVFIMIATAGWRLLLPRHRILDLLCTFFITGVGASVFLGILFETLIPLTPRIQTTRDWFIFHPWETALGLGLVGTMFEFLRIRHYRITKVVDGANRILTKL